jgi:hypothetical protein
MIESAIYSILSAHAGLKALVSTRVYPLTAPIDTVKPLVVYEKTDAQRHNVMGGKGGVSEAEIEVTGYDTTPEGAAALGVQIKAALEYYTGTSSSVVIQRIFPEGETSGFDVNTDSYFYQCQFRAFFEE